MCKGNICRCPFLVTIGGRVVVDFLCSFRYWVFICLPRVCFKGMYISEMVMLCLKWCLILKVGHSGSIVQLVG